MKIIDCTQGSLEWKAARLGIPTASEAHRLITPAKYQAAKAQDLYLAQCLAEWIMQVPLDEGGSGWMERGHEYEPDAVAWYEFEYGVEVERVGFCVNDEGTFGCSPDGLVGDNGGLEIKVPSAVNHVAYMLDPVSLYEKYKVQVQASLWVTGREWWDVMSHHPRIKNVVYRATPDPEFTKVFAPLVNTFTMALEAAKNEYRKIDPDAGKPGTEPEEYEVAEVLASYAVDFDGDELPF